MCGIFSVFNNSYDKTLIEKSFQLGKSRGPEHSSIKYLSNSSVVVDFIDFLLLDGTRLILVILFLNLLNPSLLMDVI